MLFTRTIHGWHGSPTSWAAVYQSIDAFTPLIHALARRHAIDLCEITHLTPGSNAVFRMGAYVFKIFAPIESGTSTITDYACELAGMEHAIAAGAALPRVIAHGVVQDKYSFHYIIMEFIDAPEAQKALPSISLAEKKNAALLLKQDLMRLHRPYTGAPPLPQIKWSGMDRWNEFPQSLMDDWWAVRQSLPEELVFVHGDLTGDNVLLSHGRFILLDFADCHMAPVYYEWPALIFDLLRCDTAMLDILFENWRGWNFINQLTAAILLHDFGPDILQNICRDLGIQYNDIHNMEILRQTIQNRLHA